LMKNKQEKFINTSTNNSVQKLFSQSLDIGTNMNLKRN